MAAEDIYSAGHSWWSMSTTVSPLSMLMKIPAYGARAAKAPLSPLTIERRKLGPLDVEIEILYCGICHSDVHKVNDDWSSTHFPVVPGHDIVGRVASHGASVTRFQEGDRWRALYCRFVPLVPGVPRRPRNVLRKRRDVHVRQLRPEYEDMDVRRLLYEDRR